MNDFYIVCGERHEEHADFEAAAAERDRLAANVPGRDFRVYRCKRWMQTAKHFEKLVALVADLVERGATPDIMDRARILLSTVKRRNGGQLAFLTRAPGPAEFAPRLEDAAP